MADYFKKIIDYFRFVHYRRQDLRYSVFPKLSHLIAGLSVIFVVLLVLIWKFDPVFLTDMQNPNWKKNAFFEAITGVGNSNWLLISTGIVLITLSILTADRFEGAKHMIWHRVFLYAYFLFTSVAFSGGLVNLAKLACGRTRPHFTDGTDSWFPFIFGDVFINGSFPSGHATTAGALAVGMSLLFPRVRWLIYFGFILAAISRPSIGIHYPSDVFAGAFLGAFFTYYYGRYFARKRLLFTFDDKGGIILRGEGRGKMGQLGSMVKEGFRSRDHSGV